MAKSKTEKPVAAPEPAPEPEPEPEPRRRARARVRRRPRRRPEPERGPEPATPAHLADLERARYVVSLTNANRPHVLEVPLAVNGKTYTFRRAAPIFDSKPARAAWEEATKGRPAVKPVSEHVIPLTAVQARQLAREGWGVALAGEK